MGQVLTLALCKSSILQDWYPPSENKIKEPTPHASSPALVLVFCEKRVDALSSIWIEKKNILQFLNFWINEHKSRDTMGAPRAPQVWARTSSSGGVIASHESRREAVLLDVEILNFRPSISPEKSDPFSQPFSLHDKLWIITIEDLLLIFLPFTVKIWSYLVSYNRRNLLVLKSWKAALNLDWVIDEMATPATESKKSMQNLSQVDCWGQIDIGKQCPVFLWKLRKAMNEWTNLLRRYDLLNFEDTINRFRRCSKYVWKLYVRYLYLFTLRLASQFFNIETFWRVTL